MKSSLNQAPVLAWLQHQDAPAWPLIYENRNISVYALLNRPTDSASNRTPGDPYWSRNQNYMSSIYEVGHESGPPLRLVR